MYGGLLGSAVGLWGAAVGTLSGLLIPRCRGRAWLFGLLWAGGAAGAALTLAAATAVAAGQPFVVAYAFALPGLLLLVFAGFGIPLTRGHYRAAEEARIARQDAV
jgi:hypothetical protein